MILNNVFVHFTLSDENVPFFTLFKVKGFGISISCLSLGYFCNIQISCKSACVVACRVIGGYISYRKGIRWVTIYRQRNSEEKKIKLII